MDLGARAAMAHAMASAMEVVPDPNLAPGEAREPAVGQWRL